MENATPSNASAYACKELSAKEQHRIDQVAFSKVSIVDSDKARRLEAQVPDAVLPPDRSISLSVRNLTGGGLLLQYKHGANRPLLDLLDELKQSFPGQEFQLV